MSDQTTIEKFKGDRANIEGRLADIVDRMESLSQQIVAEILREVRDDWAAIVDKAISTHADHVALLSDDELRQVKVRLADLQAQAGEIVPPHFDRPEIWNHLRPEPKRSGQISAFRPTGYDGQAEFPDLLEEPVRRALGEVGQILKQIISRDHHEWRAWQRSEWARFGEQIAPGEVSLRLLRNYAQMDLQMIRDRDRIDELSREIVRLEAESRWSSV